MERAGRPLVLMQGVAPGRADIPAVVALAQHAVAKRLLRFAAVRHEMSAAHVLALPLPPRLLLLPAHAGKHLGLGGHARKRQTHRRHNAKGELFATDHIFSFSFVVGLATGITPGLFICRKENLRHVLNGPNAFAG